MDYIIALIVIVVLVPLLIIVLTRRTKGGGGIESRDHGVTPDQPAADAPTPRPGPGVDKHLPPS